MAFSEQVQQLGAGVSAEQAVSLREFIVHLTERAEANPGVWNTSLSTLTKEASDEGFDAANLLATLKQLAKAAVPVEDQVRLAAELEKQLAGNASISEINAEISSGYPSLKAKMLELVQAAKAETRSLTGVAGGTSHKVDFKSSWNFKGWSTDSKKQRWRKAGIDSLEFLALGSLVNVGMHRYGEHKYVIQKLLEKKPENEWIDAAGGKYRYRKVLGSIGTVDLRFDNWLGKGGRLQYEAYRFAPFRILYNKVRDKVRDKVRAAMTKPPAEHERLSSEVSTYESDESDIDYMAENIEPQRLEHGIERSNLLIDLPPIGSGYRLSIKKHPDTRLAWSSALSSRTSLDRGSIFSGELKLLGTQIEKEALIGITEDVKAGENTMDDGKVLLSDVDNLDPGNVRRAASRDLSNSDISLLKTSRAPSNSDRRSSIVAGVANDPADPIDREFSGIDQGFKNEGTKASKAVSRSAERDVDREISEEADAEEDALDDAISDV